MTLETEYGNFTAESIDDLTFIAEVIEQLLRPILLSAGFGERLIIQTIGDVDAEGVRID